jgi:hypothetical protein
MAHPDLAKIRDADLLAELERYRGNPVFEVMVGHIAHKQTKRDAERAKEEAAKVEAEAKAAQRATMPRVQRKRAVIREIIETGEAITRDNLQHIHSVLALCGLPHTRQGLEVREYERRQGNSSLVIEAGKLMTSTGQWEAQPLPYGSRARLLLLHLCSEAVRQKSPTIEIADNLTAFIREVGFGVTGGKTGSLTYFKQQLNALAACRMRVGVWGPKGASTLDTKPFTSMQVWLPDNPDQQMLWPSRITFSTDFFNSLSAHALPVNMQVARALGNSSHMLDLLFWLTFKLHRLERPLTLTWEALHRQFGDTYARERKFREDFRANIATISSVLPRVPLTLSERGLTLSPADPNALALPAKRTLKKS